MQSVLQEAFGKRSCCFPTCGPSGHRAGNAPTPTAHTQAPPLFLPPARSQLCPALRKTLQNQWPGHSRALCKAT